MGADSALFSVPRLALALFVGLALEALFLAFGLYANLEMSSLCRSSSICYWIVNGVYFVLGLGLGLLLIPWTTLRGRLIVFVLILAVGLVIGIRSVHGW